MRYKNGDKVKVISDKGVYSTYLNWLTENSASIREELPHWVYGREMNDSDLEDEWTVIHSSPHLNYTKDILVFISNGEKSFMINEDCLVPKEDYEKYLTDYDSKDILKQFISLIEGNKELLEKAKKLLESV